MLRPRSPFFAAAALTVVSLFSPVLSSALSAAAPDHPDRPALLLSPPPGATAALSASVERASSTGRKTVDYADESGVRSLHRWQRLPVRVFFEEDGAYSIERREATLDGFDEWAEATGGDITYRTVRKREDADMIVRFSPRAYLPPGRGTVGRTGMSTRRGYLYRGQMELATGGVRELSELTEVAAHEWGHALGIDGHSSNPNDLMYAVTTRIISADPHYRAPIRRPTARDIATLRRAYGDGAGPRRAPATTFELPDTGR